MLGPPRPTPRRGGVAIRQHEVRGGHVEVPARVAGRASQHCLRSHLPPPRDEAQQRPVEFFGVSRDHPKNDQKPSKRQCGSPCSCLLQ